MHERRILLLTRIFRHNPYHHGIEVDNTLDYILDSDLEFQKHVPCLLNHYLAGTLCTVSYDGNGDTYIEDVCYVSQTNYVASIRPLLPGDEQALRRLLQETYGKAIETVSLYPIREIGIGRRVVTHSGSIYVLGLPIIDDRIHDAQIFKPRQKHAPQRSIGSNH